MHISLNSNFSYNLKNRGWSDGMCGFRWVVKSGYENNGLSRNLKKIKYIIFSKCEYSILNKNKHSSLHIWLCIKGTHPEFRKGGPKAFLYNTKDSWTPTAIKLVNWQTRPIFTLKFSPEYCIRGIEKGMSIANIIQYIIITLSKQ